MLRTSGVTSPASVERQVTIAGSQRRLLISRPARPIGSGSKTIERARSASIFSLV
jgi:hypothetical protein